MVLKYLLHRFLNNPQVISRLAESYPIRRAAQLTVYALSKTKVVAKEALQSTESTRRLSDIQRVFVKEVKEGFKKLEEENRQKKL